MTLSILSYTIFTALCGLATAPWHLAILRFLASLGIGGEWALGVALVVELWPDRSRTWVAGLVGAAGNVGYLLVGLLGLTLAQVVGRLSSWLTSIGVSAGTVSWLLSGEGAARGWRLLMLSGCLPALLIFFIRIFVPESHRWEAQKRRGATSYWATADLIGVLAGSAGAALIIYVWSPAGDVWSGSSRSALRAAGTAIGILVALLGFMFPVVRYVQRAVVARVLSAGDSAQTVRRLLFGAAIAGVPLLGTWGSVQWAMKWADGLSVGTPQHLRAAGYTTVCLGAGAILGTIAAAALAGRFGRRITYTFLCFGSLAACLLLYQTNSGYGNRFLACVVAVGAWTGSFYGWFPLYLPELFHTSVRATSQGFTYNFGRVVAAIGTLQTAALMAYFTHPQWSPHQAEVLSFPKAASVLAMVYLIGPAIIWLGPETRGAPLPT
jgi:MFS family permease